MSSQKETLKDRLAKRRHVRSKQFVDQKSVDETEMTLINHSPTTTRSLDRQSSRRVDQLSSSLTSSAISVDQRKPSSIPIQNPKSPPTENQNDLLSNNQTSSTPFVEQVTKNQSFESENQEEPVPIKEQQYYPNHEETPVIITRPVSPILPLPISPTNTKNSDPVQQETDENSNPHHDEEPVVVKESISPKLPPVVPPRITKKSNPVQPETYENFPSSQNEEPVVTKEINSPKLPPIVPPRSTRKSNPIQPMTGESSIRNRIQDLPQRSFDHPQSDTNNQQKHFNFPVFYPQPIPRSTSEQIVSTNNPKHQPIDPRFTKPDSLALSYVFNKRMLAAEFIRASSFDSEQSQQKTPWD
jgi:hypothetical protein